MSDRVLNFLLQVGCNLEASARSLTGSFLSETLRKPTYDRSHVYSGSEWPGFLHPPGHSFLKKGRLCDLELLVERAMDAF